MRIIEKALEYINDIARRNTEYKLPMIITFFTGLRSTEIKIHARQLEQT